MAGITRPRCARARICECAGDKHELINHTEFAASCCLPLRCRTLIGDKGGIEGKLKSHGEFMIVHERN